MVIKLNLNRNHSTASFQSPNYPQNYTDNIRCKWVIDAPGAVFIRFFIDSIETESLYDTLEICTGSYCNESTRVAVLSGLQHWKSRRVRGSRASVELKTDGSINYRGFRATARALYV